MPGGNRENAGLAVSRQLRKFSRGGGIPFPQREAKIVVELFDLVLQRIEGYVVLEDGGSERCMRRGVLCGRGHGTEQRP
jgi:hypothetical protein